MGARRQRRSKAGRDAGFGFAIETLGEMAVEVGHVLKEGECGSGEQFLELASYLTECPHQSATLKE